MLSEMAFQASAQLIPMESTSLGGTPTSVIRSKIAYEPQLRRQSFTDRNLCGQPAADLVQARFKNALSTGVPQMWFVYLLSVLTQIARMICRTSASLYPAARICDTSGNFGLHIGKKAVCGHAVLTIIFVAD